EGLVLGGDDGLLEDVGDLVVRQDRAVGVAELGHRRLAVGVRDHRGLWQWDVVGQLDAVEVVAAADHGAAGEHDEHREAGQDDVAPAGLLAARALAARTAAGGTARSVAAGAAGSARAGNQVRRRAEGSWRRGRRAADAGPPGGRGPAGRCAADRGAADPTGTGADRRPSGHRVRVVATTGSRYPRPALRRVGRVT